MSRVAVVIPVYNHEGYVGEAIRSVLEQTRAPDEIVVVDDGSTDGTPDVVKSFGAPVRYLRKANGGCPSALNHGVRHTTSDWIAWLSSDDRWLPEKLAKQMSALEDRPDAGLSYTDDFVVDQVGRRLACRRFPAHTTRTGRSIALLRRCFIDGSSVVLRKRYLEAAGNFDETDRVAHDYRMWLQFVSKYPAVHVPEPLVENRFHAGQLSRRVHEMDIASKRTAFRAAREFGPLASTLGCGLRLADELALVPLRLFSPGQHAGRLDPMAVRPWQDRQLTSLQRLGEGLHQLADTWKLLLDPNRALHNAGGASH